MVGTHWDKSRKLSFNICHIYIRCLNEHLPYKKKKYFINFFCEKVDDINFDRKHLFNTNVTLNAMLVSFEL